MNYDLKLINDYINGNDIEGYSIDELESNTDFMISVIKATNDKNFYNLCSKEVKNDYNFITFMINKFSDDHAFIDKIVTENFNDIENEEERLDIITNMCDIYDKENSYYGKYKVLFISKFLIDEVSVESYKINNPNDKDVGLGFCVFYEEYHGNKRILKYYVESMINYIFDDLKINLERRLHKEFKSTSEIEKYGIYNYMLDFLSLYDASLADYCSVHRNLLDDFKSDIDKVIKKWNSFDNKIEMRKVYDMFDRVDAFIYEHGNKTEFIEEEYLYYICKELGLFDLLVKYSNLDKETYESYYGEKDDMFKEEIKNDNDTNFMYINIKKIVMDTMFNDFELYSDEGNGKIINFNR